MKNVCKADPNRASKTRKRVLIAHRRCLLKKERFIRTFLALSMAIFLTGCGATPMIELTGEEEDVVALYAAKVVAKHNVRLAQGLVRYKGSDEDLEEASVTSDEEALKNPLEDGETETTGTEGEEAGGETDAGTNTASLNDIFPIEGIDFSFERASFESDYIFNNYYHLTPDAGKCYLIMYFNVANTTDASIDVDLYSHDPHFTATVDGSGYESEMTILPNDLATYLATVGGGKNESAVLLFEVPEGGTMDAGAVSLQVKVGDTVYDVSL